jgi:membrane protein DedA with SNARE-associated domain
MAAPRPPAPMNLQQIIEDFGHLAILVGTFLEGETIVIVAGFMAHRGYLSLPLVILCAFTGTVISDQLFFYLGHSKGQAFLARRPTWNGRVDTVRDLLHRRGVWIILGFRFLYGIRNVTPFVIGSTGYGRMRFLVLNVIGAAIWAVSFAATGFVLGEAMERVLGEIKKYEMTIAGIVLAIACTVWLWYRVRARRAKQRADRMPPLSPLGPVPAAAKPQTPVLERVSS